MIRTVADCCRDGFGAQRLGVYCSKVGLSLGRLFCLCMSSSLSLTAIRRHMTSGLVFAMILGRRVEEKQP